MGVPPSGQWRAHPAGRGYPSLGLDGGTPCQDWMGYPPPIGTGWGTPMGTVRGTPTPCWDWMGVPPVGTGWATPLLGLDGVPPLPHQETEQQSELLLRGGRYASCVHAGGISCYTHISILGPNLFAFSMQFTKFYLETKLRLTIRVFSQISQNVTAMSIEPIPQSFISDALLPELVRHVVLGRAKICMYGHPLLVLSLKTKVVQEQKKI